MLHKIILHLIHLWVNEDGFFGVGEGPSGGEKTQLGDTSGLANFATSLGEKDISQASNFWSSILSGDPGSISKVLGPQISGINKRGQESKMTGAQFGTRSGGTNASSQMTDDNTRGSIDSLISSLTGKAGEALGSLGSGLLNTGLSGHESAFGMEKTVHDQHLAKMNDIFKSIADVAGPLLLGA